MASDDALHGRQSDTGAAELALGVQALEGTKELVNVVHVETDAVVAHEESGPARVLGATELHPRAWHW